MNSIVKEKTFTASMIRELEDNSSLYVINTSDLDQRKARSELLITVDVNGRGHNLTIPPTWIPIDITSQVPLAMIKNNREFFDLYRKGYIAAIDTDLAEEILDGEDAREEFMRIYGNDTLSRNKKEAVSYTGNANVDGFIQEQLKTLSRADTTDQVSPKVFSIMNNKSISEGQRFSALKNIQPELKPEDLSYIIRNCPNSEQRIKDWAHSMSTK